MTLDESRERHAGVRECFVISVGLVGVRLDRAVAELTGRSRSQAHGLIAAGRVGVNDSKRKASYPVRAGDRVRVAPPDPIPQAAIPQDIPLSVLYEDKYLAAINKAPGMVVHPAPGRWDGTVVNALLFRWGWSDERETLRPGIVHRLDKDTSGVLLVAKQQFVLDALARQFQARRVQKTYIAVVVGQFRVPVGRIDFPVGRHPVDRKKMAVDLRSGRSSATRYQVLAAVRGLSLVRLFPETGRTHQLRVHVAALGCPILGDTVYGTARAWRVLWPAVRSFPRQALHAETIRFRHPVRAQDMTVCAPYPPDLTRLLALFDDHPQSERRGSFD